MTKRTNKLTSAELIRVTRHLDAYRSRFEGMNPIDVIDVITKETGIEMTRNNLDGIRRIEGYEWLCPTARSSSIQDANTKILARSMVRLHQQVGVDAPESLAILAGVDGDG